ncbi:serine/threonine-protein kinase pakD [Teleopsis dalmanni]|uniref:serine/threonine-protein kinase pakD n=1 Tax=Teleopsis dalmanni TaxID=139649 RepID=UPI0018CD45C0|nr:serine/threonine-protein kinase pakD [Teleopsis dalmanni]
MTELRRAFEARIHQSQNYRDSYFTGYNATQDGKTYPAANEPAAQTLTNGTARNPLLQSLSDHTNMGSTSGGSTASSTATTATATTIGRNCNGNTSAAEVQFDEREIYYVSPTKRKGSLSATSSQNNVTFSNCVNEQRIAQNRGSLRRSKGRSNQSLCSCDAGADTEINPDPTRPLYQYSLERRHKGHTYTCEQNAQILMRLERERKRKLSLSGSIGAGVGGGSSDSTNDAKEDLQSDTLSSSDVDNIPPVPPPPTLKRNGSMRSLRLFQLQQQQQQQCPTGTCVASNTNSNLNNINNNNNKQPIATLCNGNMLSDCANSAIDVGSMIDDCTTSILKCANAVGTEIIGTNTSLNTNKSHIATLATIASNSKPDVCHVDSNLGTSFNNYLPPYVRDDIFMPNSKKTDPSLCFLRAGPKGIAPISDQFKSQRDLKNSRSTLSLSKYNTIGASSDCARQLAQYNQQMQEQHQHMQQQPQRISERCRCFSQSLSNFSRDYFGQQQQQQQRTSSINFASSNANDKHNNKHNIFYTGDENDWLNGRPPPPPPVISRSFNNLVDIDGHHVSSTTRLPYQKFNTPTDAYNSSCSFGAALHLLNNASFTTLDSSNSGLKEKLHQQQHSHQHQHHHHHEHHLHNHQTTVHHKHHNHQQQQQQQQQQQHTTSQQQKHNQLHASVTSIMPWKHRQCPSRGSSSSGTNSFRFDAAKHWLAVSSILLIIGAASVAVPLALRVAASAPFEERLSVAEQLLDQVPLIDGHNDLPWNIRKFLHNKLNEFNFDQDLRNVMPWARSLWSHTDLQRLKKGRISAQFWAAYVPCEAQHRDAVQLTLEQIDVIKRLTDRYSPQLTTCTSSEDIIEAHKNHQLCSLTGVEGGHSLGGSLAVLRTLYAIGVRYMTLTSTCHTPWADSSYADAPTYNVKHGGLTIFGKVSAFYVMYERINHQAQW